MTKYDFKEIYEANFNYVYSFIFSRLAENRSITEDIVQETFVSALKSIKRFSGKSSYRTWLCGIAKNLIFNYYRSSIDAENLSYEDDIGDVKGFEDVEIKIMDKEFKASVLSTLNKIKPSYKYVLILKYMDDYSVAEIASCLHKTPKAIDGLLQRAKASFKREYMLMEGEN